MSSLSITFNTRQLRDHLRDMRRRLPRVVADGVKKIAEDSLNDRYLVGPKWGGNLQEAAHDGDAGMMHGRLQKLDARFIPVTLKGLRTERWPDVAGLYYHRLRPYTRAGVYVRKFWVDEQKLAELRRQIIAKWLRRLSPGDWKITLTSDFGDIKVTIKKQGRATRADHETAQMLTGLMQVMFAERASDMIYRALQ